MLGFREDAEARRVHVLHVTSTGTPLDTEPSCYTSTQIFHL